MAHEGWRTGRAARFGDDVSICSRAQADATGGRAGAKPNADPDANAGAHSDANAAAARAVATPAAARADATSAATRAVATPAAARADTTPAATRAVATPAAARADTTPAAARAVATRAAARADDGIAINTRINIGADTTTIVANGCINAGASTGDNTHADASCRAAEAAGDVGDDGKTGAQGSGHNGTHDQTQVRVGTTSRTTVVELSRRGGHAIRGSLSDMFGRSLRRVAHSMTHSPEKGLQSGSPRRAAGAP
jgi:hypothetical protein